MREQRRQRIGERRFIAVALDEFGHDILAQHQIGENDRGHVDEMLGQLLDARDLVGDDHGHAGKREFERDRAGRDERRARAAEGGEFRLIAEHDFRLVGPGAQLLANGVFEMRDSGQDDFHTTAMLRDAMQHLAEDRHQPFDLGAPRARHQQEYGGIVFAVARIFRIGTQFVEMFDERVADEDTGRAAQLFMRRWLERKQREHAIDIGAHGRRPA
ncbi:MAG: hypothetical protein KDJ20_08125, partial [Hyphomicrobiales bacterium]|nr:hypothetical protein [Hyphomicrobiales bacterium]